MMTKFRSLLLCLMLLVSVCGFSQAEEKSELTWYTNILEANLVAKKENKPLFAFFTGSDWCGWCRKIQQDVFAKPEFIQWAKKNVILVELDFPRRKQQPQEIVQQNQGLQQAFQVRGYPTIWIFNLSKKADEPSFEIEQLGSLGYPSGAELGREQLKFLADANAILANKKK